MQERGGWPAVWNLQWSVCIRLGGLTVSLTVCCCPSPFIFLLYTYIRRRRLYAWDNWIMSAYIYRARAWPRRRRRQPLRQHAHSSLSLSVCLHHPVAASWLAPESTLISFVSLSLSLSLTKCPSSDCDDPMQLLPSYLVYKGLGEIDS